MAIIHDDIWGGGAKKRITPGVHYPTVQYGMTVESLVVPAGQVVTLYEDQGAKGKKSLPLYEGTYQNLVFYGVSSPGRIDVEKTDLTVKDMIEIGWDHKWGSKDGDIHPMHYRVPIGDRHYDVDFPGDKMQWARIPYGLRVEAYVDPNFQGEMLVMTGNDINEPQMWNLSHFETKSTKYKRFSWNVSSMKIRADDWEQAGVELRNVEIDENDSNKFAGITELCNNSPHKTVVGKEIEWEKEKQVEEDWNIEAGVTAKAGFEAQAMNITVTGELEVTAKAGYGETKSHGESKTVTDTVQAEVEGYGRVKISTIIVYGKMVADAIKKWRNKRTDAVIEQKGRIICNWSNDAKHEVVGWGKAEVAEREESKEVRLQEYAALPGEASIS